MTGWVIAAFFLGLWCGFGWMIRDHGKGRGGHDTCRRCNIGLLLAVAVLVGGCAARAHPPALCVLYCRQTFNCKAGEVPTQLEPQTKRRAPDEAATPPTPACDTMEVGAMTYKDTIVALGSALAMILTRIPW